MILITDSHVQNPAGDGAEFLRMLEHLGGGRQDIVFLGDIFDLWIALPGYETPLQGQFLAWCRAQRRQRTVGFMEGNHEFFVCQAHRAAFSWCSADATFHDGQGRFFSHGDRINRQDLNYRRFRRLVKNPLTRTLLPAIPLGPSLAEWCKQRLRRANVNFRKHLPASDIAAFAAASARSGARHLFIGHFHRPLRQPMADGPVLHLLPAWHASGQVTLFDEQTGIATCTHWREVAAGTRA
jgi:UDP-2,3-diacylglucosamine hydrolase